MPEHSGAVVWRHVAKQALLVLIGTLVGTVIGPRHLIIEVCGRAGLRRPSPGWADRTPTPATSVRLLPGHGGTSPSETGCQDEVRLVGSASVAQWTERLRPKEGVGSSILSGGTP